MLASKLLEAAGNSTTPAYIEDVFSTYLYTGTNASKTITNGIDVAGKGGLVWIKDRTAANDHLLYDTVRGAGSMLSTDSTGAAISYSTAYDLASFTSTGFTLGANGYGANVNNDNEASWTFRKQPKFFDVVTYTGDGNTGRQIAHNLGSAPGCIIVKCTSSTTNWPVYHRGIANSYLTLNSTDANSASTAKYYWGDDTTVIAPTSTNFTVGGSTVGYSVNGAGQTYVAYIFAHNAGGFGLTGTDNVISCGSYTGATTGTQINLGWEPQYLLIKCATASSNWFVIDNMRGWTAGGIDKFLYPNTSGAEYTDGNDYIELNATGFKIGSDGFFQNANVGGTQTFIYIAIRRGPMKVPTDATKVFSPNAYTETLPNPTVLSAGFPPDMYMTSTRNPAYGFYVMDKLRGSNQANNNFLVTPSTAAEGTTGTSPAKFDYSNDGIAITYLSNNTAGRTDIVYQFRRAPNFFDEVCYTGDGTTTTAFNHNLGVSPELIIAKCRSTTTGADHWIVTAKSGLGTSDWYGTIRLNATDAKQYDTNLFASVTSTTFTPKDTWWNQAGKNFVAYLFATCAGVSKVGSYTGTGTTKQVDCGFTAGARFVLIKRTDDVGDWYVWDSARGIVSGNDPYLKLNSTAAEVTTTDYIDPYSAGFELSSTAPAALNASGGTYIFLAIA